MRSFILALALVATTQVWSQTAVFKHQKSNKYLKVEMLVNDGVYVEIIEGKPNNDRIWAGPMVLESSLGLDKKAVTKKNILESTRLKVAVDTKNLCVTTFDKKQKWKLATVCPRNMYNAWKGLSIDSSKVQNLYGLGQYFTNPGTADGDLVGRTWDPLMHTHGNALRTFSKGANSYAMFPVLYALGEGHKNFLFVYNNVYKQYWNLKNNPYTVDSYGDTLRYFIYAADNVKALRSKYMGLTGHAPVPKKDVFGLWLSEFGYDNWDEVKNEVAALRKSGFPVDGAALDLQWFGGSFFMGDVDRSGSRFGTLRFDEKNFPNAKQEIARFKQQEGLSLMPIEESYISKWLPEHGNLARYNFMANWCGTNSPAELTANPWWGIGGMIDWTNPKAGDYWHDEKRQKLVELGLTHHWTDLGEPEMYSEHACYYGHPELGKHRHADVHNIYNLKWVESIARGYERNRVSERPYIMSRSGNMGLQRFGAGMWSGDIGANMNAMTAHYNAQLHMTFSGIDYYGSDIGGFHRTAYSLDGDPNELFTQWFANAALFDFPVRAHTWNLSNQVETNPSEIGDTKSNLANIQLRYKLFPYYYSLAHKAYLEGTTIVSPMVMEFPLDKSVRKMGNQKMIGSSLLAAMVARYGENARNVYLPKGTWFNFHTGAQYKSRGQYVGPISAYNKGAFQIPLFVKAGSIIPTMQVDKHTMNISGKRRDGARDHSLSLLIAPSVSKTSFSIFEDDGTSVEYKKGKVAKTVITQQSNTIMISKTSGSYAGLKTTRDLKLELVMSKLSSVVHNGKRYSVNKVAGKANTWTVTIPKLNLKQNNKLTLSN
jgi:alpha-glucosidase (family GH31 glycosyl hydrolase)